MQWVRIRDVEEIPKKVMSVRTGADVFFAAYSAALDQWYMVVPGHGEERIEPPTEIFIEQGVEPPRWLDDPQQMELDL
jgi:hypothetical protein